MTLTELQKLNVTQLRLLCKEKKITGYSKTPKEVLIEKLLAWQKPQPTPLKKIVSLAYIACDIAQPAGTTDNSTLGTETYTAIPDSSSTAYIEALTTHASQNGARHVAAPSGSAYVTSMTPPTSIKRPATESGQVYARKIVKVSHRSNQEPPSKYPDEKAKSTGNTANSNPMSILDAQQITNDIWEITTHSASSISSYYILEGTCEVIGHPPASQMKPSDVVHLRADWSAYIGARIRKGESGAVDLRQNPDLLDQLQWTNHEEYDKGLTRRYVLACVVGNSVSGPWLSSSEMHQEFSGLQSHVSTTRDHRTQRVNLFLPAHHHVESVHFSSSGNRALHPAVAAVQTPRREYFILRDNGMQIGCEEEGIAPVWMKILGCTAIGVHHG
ncbi:unnamed protein product [Cyclocybe aegerita]|uniref:Rho termination factor N-terminal domain-containing protein n=1 Tax=Cyclocybe aegerita TaxID=1973307 RepID=A0A8S0WN54_CYCAE|nr:unnamed protein product [Cyclocybe aegerita]